MNRNIDLLKYYPKSNFSRSVRHKPSTAEKVLARKFSKSYFDGDRQQGYGGYYYDPKFWTRTANYIINFYNLDSSSIVLDIGCAKGFLIKDLLLTGKIKDVFGIDISQYALENCESEVLDNVLMANAKNLPFKDQKFDLVLAINTIHNLEFSDCLDSLREINRVSKKFAFVMVDGWDNEYERLELDNWILTAKTVKSRSDWLDIFKLTDYKGDYFLWKFN